MQKAWRTQSTLEQEEEGSQTDVSEGENGIDLLHTLTQFQEKLDSVNYRKSCRIMKISHCIQLAQLRTIYRMS